MLAYPPTILIADDDRGFRETVGSVLAADGYRTWTAAEGTEALRIVRSEEIHVVLLDMHMPRLTGIEVLRQLKDLKALLPCILVSAAVDEQLRQAALRERAFSILAKPVDRQTVRGAIRSAIVTIYGVELDGMFQRSQTPTSDRLPPLS